MFQRRGLLWFGLQYCTTESTAKVKNDVEDFLLDNDLDAYFLGICQDFKHFGFAVSVLILNEDGTKIVRLLRKEACCCRFTPADSHGRISKILYANWRKPVSSRVDTSTFAPRFGEQIFFNKFSSEQNSGLNCL